VNFKIQYDPSRTTLENGYWFLFKDGQLLVRKNEGDGVETLRRESAARDPALESIGLRVKKAVFFGTYEGIDCFAASIGEDDAFPDGYVFMGLRPLYGKIPQDYMHVARFAIHLLHWDRNSGFCGACGARNRDKSDERAKVCSACGNVVYPRISPAVIVAILDGGRILLAHNRRFTTQIYSLIAGFVEIGETLEECVHREVEEAVGLKVKNIRYFASQPWPFPDSLMLGFTAEYAGGEIRVDPKELVDAKWFEPPNLPSLPPSDSIARKIITWYEQEYYPGRKSRP